MDLIMILYLSSSPTLVILGRLPGSSVYRNVYRYPQSLVRKGMLIIRLDTPLYFVNVHFFRNRLHNLQLKYPSQCIVLDFSGINGIDTTAIGVLFEIMKDLKSHNTIILIASVKGYVRDLMLKAGLVDLIGAENFFWELHEAVLNGCELLTKERTEEHILSYSVKTREYSPHIFEVEEHKI